jgi:AcrR family transcriptional regulator
MARKNSYSEKSIVDATLDLIAKYGKESFSVRNVARHLNASTQPIYSYFRDSNQLYQKVLIEIEDRLLKQVNYPYTDFVFRNVGIGFMLFAKENPNLFDAFFSDLKMNQLFVGKFLSKLREIVDKDERFKKISKQGKDILLKTMWTYSYGYAFLIIKGLTEDTSDKIIKERITETGLAIISHIFQKEKIG